MENLNLSKLAKGVDLILKEAIKLEKPLKDFFSNDVRALVTPNPRIEETIVFSISKEDSTSIHWVKEKGHYFCFINITILNIYIYMYMYILYIYIYIPLKKLVKTAMVGLSRLYCVLDMGQFGYVWIIWKTWKVNPLPNCHHYSLLTQRKYSSDFSF